MSLATDSLPRRLRVLAVSMAAPNVPGGGGATRAYHLLEALCDIADVSLVSLGSVPGRGCVSARLAGRCERVVEPLPAIEAASTRRSSRMRSWLRFADVLVRPSRNYWLDFFYYYLQHGMPDLNVHLRAGFVRRLIQVWWRLMSRFSDMPPIQVMFLAHAWRSCEAEVRRLLQSEQFDVLWCEEALCYWFLQDLHKEFPKLQLVASAHNIEFILRQRLRDTAEHALLARHWEAQAKCCLRLEKKIYRRADLTIVCSDADASAGERFFAQGGFAVIGNGVDTAYFNRAAVIAPAVEPILLFTGGFGYDPNADAVRHFIQNILPFVRGEVPNCKFVFAGREAKRLLQALNVREPGVNAIDSPEDMRPIFESATVFVVPLLSGGGTRLKILEAMAMQLPIVSTAIGAEGLGCLPGEHLLIADDDRAFAEAVVALLQDEQRRRAMGAAARDWVCSNMDWNIHRERLKRVVLDYARAKTGAAES